MTRSAPCPIRRIFLLAVAATALANGLLAQDADGAKLRKAADETLGLSNNVEARRKVDTVFLYTDWLLAAGKRKDAIRYLKSGLKLDPYRLDQQLSLAKALAGEKDQKGATEAAQAVVRRAEDDRLVVEARTLLGQTSPETMLAPLSAAPTEIPAIVLVPIGDCDLILLKEFGEQLASKLGVSVSPWKLDVAMPKPAKDSYGDLLVNLRVIYREVVKKEGKKTLDRLKLKPEDLADDAKLLQFTRAWTLESEGGAALAAFEKDLKTRTLNRQWEAEKLLDALQTATAPHRKKGIAYIGVTKNDMFGKGTNYLFGLSSMGAGVISYSHFRAEFNEQPPDRKRLLNRMLKQGQSTAGFAFGIARCESPECARAYPHSLDEHDSKPDEMCATCKAAWQKALAGLK